jgi:hypothetical protein
MAFDYKKEYKEFYLPKQEPSFVPVPTMNYVAARGKGNPNEDNGLYMEAVQLLYSISYTIKMSKKTDHRMEGYFDYVVPPLEGLWWEVVNGNTVKGFSYKDKALLNWISMIRLPDFVTREEFEWAIAETSRKKSIDCSKAEFLTIEENLCAQIMHIGSYDEEPVTIAKLEQFIIDNGYSINIDNTSLFHHEIYLSDPRKTDSAKCKTIIRYPVKKRIV